MTKIAISPNVSGTGTFTIAAPDSNTDRTLTLPDAGGVVATQEYIPTALNATGSAPIYACRAWVNFNGTGTVAIRASGNVSSITDNGTGNYTVNFTTAMPDVNYSAQITKEPSAFLAGNTVYDGRLYSTTSALLVLSAENSALSDSANINVAVFR